jgi:hypothetical protein
MNKAQDLKLIKLISFPTMIPTLIQIEQSKQIKLYPAKILHFVFDKTNQCLTYWSNSKS